MGEYMPSDEDIRRYAAVGGRWPMAAGSEARAAETYDRWLAAHDARIASEAAESALREAADDLRIESENAEPEKPSAYREGVAAGLLQAEDIARTRAERLRAEREGAGGVES